MDKNLEEAQDRFIEGIARISELMGFSDGMGRIYGYLYMSPLPLSLDDICERLSLTKGTVSLYLKQMEERNIIRRVRVRNNRKKFYEIIPDIHQVMSAIFQERLKKKIEVVLSTLDSSMELVEKSLPELELEERNQASLIFHRLSVFKDFSSKAFKLMTYIHSEIKEPDDFEKIKKIDIR